ncbi:MAG: serine hydrolase [Mycobacterium sp.]|nr:serine hydrolase [Mycobacterium sp.]
MGGFCAPEFDAVRIEFERNFAARGEVGAAVAGFVDGELVINLWGGWQDAAGEVPWHEGTLASVFSGSKGVTSTCIHLLAERGIIDLQAPVARYWPEFAQNGKAHITIAMVLSHRSGVIGPQRRLSTSEVLDWDHVCTELAASAPWWEPGAAQGYHMVTFGFILGEVAKRVTGRTVGELLRDEIAGPLGADVFIGLPEEHHARCADMINKPHIRAVLGDAGAPERPTSLAEHRKAGLSVAMGFIPDDEVGSDTIDRWRSMEFPATNAHVSALGMATVYNSIAQGKVISHELMDLCRISQGGFDTDLVLGPRVADHGWGLGYMLNQRQVNGPNARIFGHGGSGGSFAFVDPENGIAYAYVMNFFDATKANADPRSVALSDEIYAALGVAS